MGRTNPTYRDLLESVEERWGTYRRGLRRDDKPHFDRLFVYARGHADASGLQNHDDPMATVLLSIALEQEKELATLTERVEALEAAIEADASSTADVPSAAAMEDDPSEAAVARDDPSEARE